MTEFNEARKYATKKVDSRNYVFGAVAVRSDGTKVFSRNGMNKDKDFRCHAEARICRKLDIGAIVWVVRVSRATGTLLFARPCHHCQKILRTTGVRKCYYSISETEYGAIEF